MCIKAARQVIQEAVSEKLHATEIEADSRSNVLGSTAWLAKAMAEEGLTEDVNQRPGH